MRVKSLVAVLLAIALCFCSACSSKLAGEHSSERDPNEITSETAPNTGAISLAYSSTDTLDPYTAVTKYNKELCQLIYDSLIVLDADFRPVYRLADAINLEGKNCSVTIKNTIFSDGTPVTAEDVVYSLKKAQQSTTKFSAQLSKVSSCSASGNRTVLITLSSFDPYFINLLDFPVLKKGSDNLKNDDGKILPPKGSGRYIFDTGNNILTANPNYAGGKMALETITLINTPDDESLTHNIEVGNISMSYHDFADNKPIKMTGKSLSIGLNNLVYLGINFSNPYLSDPRFRQALSLALNRQKIAESSYTGYATAARGPFPANWKEVYGLQTMADSADTGRAVAILKEIGYNTKDNDGYFLDGIGKRIRLTILCNADNSARTSAARLIQAQLKDIGIYADVRTVNWDAYMAELQGGTFDLYIGEVKLQNNMDISPLVTLESGVCFGYIKTPDPASTSSNSSSNTSASSGTASANNTSSNSQTTSDSTANTQNNASSAYVTVSAYDMVKNMQEGKVTVADVLAAFNAELPIIPICHRKGQVAYTSAIDSGLASTATDLFYGIETITFH